MKFFPWLLLLLIRFTAYSQVGDTAHNPPHWMVWQEHSSPIPFNYVTDISISKSGHKWLSFCQNFGNNRGAAVARFDSAEWKRWMYPSGSCINVVGAGNDDTAYFGFVRDFAPGPFVRIAVEEIQVVNACPNVAFYRDIRQQDTALALFSGYIATLNDAGECHIAQPNVGAISIYWDHPGWYILGSRGGGIYLYNGLDTVPLSIATDSIDFSQSDVNALAIEPDPTASTGLGGKLWFAYWWRTRNESFSGLGIWDGRQVEIIKKDQIGIRSNLIYHLKRNPLDGSMWVGSQDGLARYHQGQWTAFNFGTGFMVGNQITDIEMDALGNTWIGTNNGLVAYNDQGVVFSKRPIPKPAQPLKVFPNPAHEQTTLELWTEGPTQATISLHNLSGKLLRQETWNIAEGGLHQHTLGLTGLARGMYVVVVESGKGRYYNRLLKF